MKCLNFLIRINIWEMPGLSLCRMNGYTHWNYVVDLFNYSKEFAKLYQNHALTTPFKSSQSPTTRQPKIWITERITKYNTEWKHLVNKSPTRCSLFHFVYFRSTCFGHGACPSSGVVCKNCRGSHQCVSMRVVYVRWVRVGCPWGWCVYWSPSYTKLAQSWV